MDVRRDEMGALLLSFCYFFALLCGYYVLRPIRDTTDLARRTAEAERSGSPELVKKLEELKALDRQAADAMRNAMQAQAALRKAERQRAQVQAAADELRRAAATRNATE